MTERAQQPSLSQLPGQTSEELARAKQQSFQSSNAGFNARQGSNQPESQLRGSANKQQNVLSFNQQQQRQQQPQQQGWQPLIDAPGESSSTSEGFTSGGVRAIVKDTSGQTLNDPTIRVRVKGEQERPVETSTRREERSEEDWLPQAFRDLGPGEMLHPLDDIDDRAIWASRPATKHSPEGSSLYEPFLAKSSTHKPLNEATIYERQQEVQRQQPREVWQSRRQGAWEDKELRQWSTSGSAERTSQPVQFQTSEPEPEWSRKPKEQPLQDWARSGKLQSQLPPVQPLAPKKISKPVRYPPTPDQLRTQKGKLSRGPKSQEFLGKTVPPEMTRPGVDDSRATQSSGPTIRREGEMVQMEPGRTSVSDKTTTTAQMEQSGIVLKGDVPPHVEAIPLDQTDEHSRKEGFFGKLKHMFSDKKEA